MNKRSFLFTAAYAAAFLLISIAHGAGPSHARARLVLGRDVVRPGETIPVGIEMTMDPGWHTYWKNPGDAGMATRVQWSLPAGFNAGPLQFPYPERFASSNVVTFGYTGAAMLISEIRTPRAMPKSGETEISALVKWLECSDVCIPGNAKLSARLSFGADAPVKSEIMRGAASIPGPLPRDWTAKASRRGQSIELVVAPAAGSAAIDGAADFFPDRDGVVESGALEIHDAAKGGITLDLNRSHAPGSEKEKTLSGVVVLKKDRRAFEISVPIQDK